MAALGTPGRTLRGLFRELRYLDAAMSRPYRDSEAYRYLLKAFRAHRVRQPQLRGDGEENTSMFVFGNPPCPEHQTRSGWSTMRSGVRGNGNARLVSLQG